MRGNGAQQTEHTRVVPLVCWTFSTKEYKWKNSKTIGVDTEILTREDSDVANWLSLCDESKDQVYEW